VRHFVVELYDWKVSYFTDREKFARATARAGLGKLSERRKAVSDCVGIATTDTDTMRAYIGVFNSMPCTLAHECVHAAMAILGSAGVRVTPDNNEALAYLVEHIFDRCSA
jgi:hypothetical protein